MHNLTDLREAIDRRRRHLGLTQSDLAAAAGMHQPHLSAWLSGRRDYISTEALECILARLALTVAPEGEPAASTPPPPSQTPPKPVALPRRW